MDGYIIKCCKITFLFKKKKKNMHTSINLRIIDRYEQGPHIKLWALYEIS